MSGDTFPEAIESEVHGLFLRRCRFARTVAARLDGRVVPAECPIYRQALAPDPVDPHLELKACHEILEPPP